ncbi:ThuA domain-containing protein [Candidatus Latescibacterota bacterium]
MASPGKTTRRKVMKAGLATAATAAASAFTVKESHAAMPKDIRPKAKGETRVVFLGGDQLHNFAAQEPALRRICERAGWKFFAIHDARYLTPEVVGEADLLMIQRWDGNVLGWVSGPIQEEGATMDGYMSDELEASIVDNVKNRGMGYMSLHCSIAAMEKRDYMDLIGVNMIIHGPLQSLRVHNFNQDHPITKGMTDFDIALDENFGAELINKNAVKLYESTGYMDKRHDVGGWCLEQGKGRVVGLLAGHTYFAYEDPNYLQLYWRGAHWALKRDIPPYRR